MRKCCNRCKVDLEDDCFLADSGEYLCEKCSVGVKPVDREWLATVMAKIKNK